MTGKMGPILLSPPATRRAQCRVREGRQICEPKGTPGVAQGLVPSLASEEQMGMEARRKGVRESLTRLRDSLPPRASETQEPKRNWCG